MSEANHKAILAKKKNKKKDIFAMNMESEIL